MKKEEREIKKGNEKFIINKDEVLLFEVIMKVYLVVELEEEVYKKCIIWKRWFILKVQWDIKTSWIGWWNGSHGWSDD